MLYIILCIFSQDGQTPLLLAVRKRNIAIARELLEAEVDVNYIEQVCDMGIK